VGIYEAVFLGIVQGITEFLPVSSSGHLVLFHTFFGYSGSRVLVDVLLHAGTFVAVVIFFHRAIIGLFKDRKLLLLICVGSLPVAVFGFIFAKEIESIFNNANAVGVALIITGVWLFLAHLVSHKRVEADSKLSVLHALLIGTAQAAAMIPGISRSGATIATAVLLGRDRAEAFRFSFLLFLPAMLGAFIYKLGSLECITRGELLVTIWGSVAACIVGICALWILKRVVLNSKLYYFSIYCWVIGIVVLIV